MVNFTGKLYINEDGELCIFGQIAKGNPTRYELPLTEIWESYLEKEVSIDIYELEQRWKKRADK